VVVLVFEMCLQQHIDTCRESFVVSFAVSVEDMIIDLEGRLVAIKGYFFDMSGEGRVVLGVNLQESYFLWFG